MTSELYRMAEKKPADPCDISSESAVPAAVGESPAAARTDAAPEETAPVTATQSDDLQGLSVFPGVACGTAFFFSSSDLEISQFQIESSAVRGELQRLRMAAATVSKDLAGLSSELEDETLNEAASFLDVHRSIIEDPTLISETGVIIREKLVNAEWALSLRLEQIRRDFEQIEDDYLRERIEDIAWVFQRIQRVLAGRRSAKSLLSADAVDAPVILVSDSLDPADMLQLRERDDLDIVGIVMAEGSVTSHAAILAHSFEIPTLVGVHDVLEQVQSGDEVLVDAEKGILRIGPNAAEKKKAAKFMREIRARRRELVKLKTAKAVTKDGAVISLWANIALSEDLTDARRAGAEGIGLFRTEFLYLNRTDLPSEEEQTGAYRKIIRGMKDRIVTIRTADLGGDKMLSKESMSLLEEEPIDEANPALGLRALRFSFAYPELFQTQLRAILRAGVNTSVRILLPMISSLADVRNALAAIEEAKNSLERDNLRYCDEVRVGGMIETPAAIAMLGDLIPLLDFFSLGTNDLVQYTLAVDRTNAAVSSYYEETHPAVLRFISESIKRVLSAGKDISVCGEMAGRADLTPFFIGLGCRALSMDSSHIPSVKERILTLNLEACEESARSLIRRKSSESARKAIAEFALANPVKENVHVDA